MIFTAHVSIKTVVLSSMVSFAFGMLIQMFLTRKVRRIDMVEALKSVE
jgi:ABC-type antimicrobial peptide transport system permease subunit